jgi:predicted RNase H-like HicB family nuclease
MARKRYVVVLEQTPNNWCAYAPDVWGCIATGKTREETERNIREALEFHFEGMSESGEEIPAPGTWTAMVDVEVPEDAPATPAGRPAEAR